MDPDDGAPPATAIADGGADGGVARTDGGSGERDGGAGPGPADAGPPSTDPACVRLAATAEDAHVVSLPVWAGSNFGDAEILTIARWPGGADGGPLDEARALLKFPLWSLPGNPGQVLLRLWVMQVGGSCAQGRISAYRITQGWSDNHVTWETQPDHDPGAIFGTLPLSADAFGYISIDITALYHRWEIDGPLASFGLMLRADCADAWNVVVASTNLACDAVDPTPHRPALLFNTAACPDDPPAPAPIRDIDCAPPADGG